MSIVNNMFHYSSCGLKNIWLKNGYEVKETPYGRAVSIHNLKGLHDAIGKVLVCNRPRLNGDEVRFLRKELNLPQTRLADLLGVSENSIRGWERKRTPIPKAPDRLLRVLYNDGHVREIIERLAELDQREALTRLELEETNSGWRAAA